MQLSVPLHTDRQDVLVLQTAGTKRWRVYPPPPRKKNVDPLNRGKSGDILSFEEYKTETPALLDIILNEGDVLYVPTGFPHTTDTVTVPDNSKDVFKETSVHLTMGLDTHVWGLTYAHLRWSLLQRCGKEFTLNIENDELYWRAMETIPVGFLGKTDDWIKDTKLDFYDKVAQQLKTIMMELEPNRWTDNEELPNDDEFREVIVYMLEKHLKPLFQIQDEMFRNVNPKSEDTIVKAYQGTQKQNIIMEEFGKFSKNKALEDSFKKVREMRQSKIDDTQL